MHSAFWEFAMFMIFAGALFELGHMLLGRKK